MYHEPMADLSEKVRKERRNYSEGNRSRRSHPNPVIEWRHPSSLFEKEEKERQKELQPSQGLQEGLKPTSICSHRVYVGLHSLSLLPPLIWAARSINRGRNIHTTHNEEGADGGSEDPHFPIPSLKERTAQGSTHRYTPIY